MRIGIVGGGNMGSAIINGIRGKYTIAVCEQDKKKGAALKRRFKISILDLVQLTAASDVLIIAVKPQDMEEVLNKIRCGLKKSILVISIAAGITTAFIERKIGGKLRVVRTMPNMPAQIGEGITAICRGKYATAADVNLACRIFDCVGTTVVVQEKLIDAITAVSGSGPAYVFLFAECLAKAAEKLGLAQSLVQPLVRQTLLGSVHQWIQSGEDPVVLRAQVTSKGGTTQAAMDIFERKRIRQTFIQALAAAKKRAGQLSKK